MITERIKLAGTAQGRQQKLLQKLYRKEPPFENMHGIEIVPRVYNDKEMYLVRMNDIDIGFFPQDTEIDTKVKIKCEKKKGHPEKHITAAI